MSLPIPKDDKKLEFVIPDVVRGSVWDEDVINRARAATLEIFAEDDSASVQVRTNCSCLRLEEA